MTDIQTTIEDGSNIDLSSQAGLGLSYRINDKTFDVATGTGLTVSSGTDIRYTLDPSNIEDHLSIPSFEFKDNMFIECEFKSRLDTACYLLSSDTNNYIQLHSGTSTSIGSIKIDGEEHEWADPDFINYHDNNARIIRIECVGNTYKVFRKTVDVDDSLVLIDTLTFSEKRMLPITRLGDNITGSISNVNLNNTRIYPINTGTGATLYDVIEVPSTQQYRFDGSDFIDIPDVHLSKSDVIKFNFIYDETGQNTRRSFFDTPENHIRVCMTEDNKWEINGVLVTVNDQLVITGDDVDMSQKEISVHCLLLESTSINIFGADYSGLDNVKGIMFDIQILQILRSSDNLWNDEPYVALGTELPNKPITTTYNCPMNSNVEVVAIVNGLTTGSFKVHVGNDVTELSSDGALHNFIETGSYNTFSLSTGAISPNKDASIEIEFYEIGSFTTVDYPVNDGSDILVDNIGKPVENWTFGDVTDINVPTHDYNFGINTFERPFNKSDKFRVKLNNQTGKTIGLFIGYKGYHGGVVSVGPGLFDEVVTASRSGLSTPQMGFRALYANTPVIGTVSDISIINEPVDTKATIISYSYSNWESISVTDGEIIEGFVESNWSTGTSGSKVEVDGDYIIDTLLRSRDCVSLGNDAGNVQGTKSVNIGYNAGRSESQSRKLHIADNADESLIEGDFKNKTVDIHGNVTASKFIGDGSLLTNIPTTNIVREQFANVHEMKQANIAIGTPVTTLGYHKSGIGSASYIAVNSKPKIPEGSHMTSNGVWLELLYGTLLTPEMFGAVGDAVTNDIQAFRDATKWMNDKMLETHLDKWPHYAEQGFTLTLGNARYGLMNSESDFDSGSEAAILLPPKCGIVGQGRGASSFVMLNGSAGHCIANRNFKNRYNKDDIFTLRSFSIYGRRWSYWLSDAKYNGDGIHFRWAYGNMTQVDNFTVIDNVFVEFVKGTALYVSGRGECIISNSFFGHSLIGIYASLYDSQFSNVNAGGNRLTGIVSKGSSTRWLGCKSFYNGVDGKTSASKSANWYLDSDGWVTGSQTYIGCESQESRGCGWVISSGLNILSSCTSADPARSAIASGTLPNVISHYYIVGGGLDSANAYNTFTNCVAYPALTKSYSNRSTKPIYSPSSAVHIGRNVRGLVGNVITYPTCIYKKGVISCDYDEPTTLNPNFTVDSESTANITLHNAPTFEITQVPDGFGIVITQGESVNRLSPYYVVTLSADGVPEWEVLLKDLGQDQTITDEGYYGSGVPLNPNKEYTIKVAVGSNTGHGHFSAEQKHTPS